MADKINKTTIGQTFNTAFERGCVTISEPDADGNFLARDSEGVVCHFNIMMITEGDPSVEEEEDEPTYERIVRRAVALFKSQEEAERPGPGRYEGNEDAVLARWLDGFPVDEETGSVEEGGWTGRIGRFCVDEDDLGFFAFYDHGSEEAARRWFARLLEEEKPEEDELR